MTVALFRIRRPSRAAVSTILCTLALSCASVNKAGSVPLREDVRQFSEIVALAQESAAKPFAPPVPRIPEKIQNLDYDQYRKIPFLAQNALWRNTGLPFEFSFYHPGYLFDEPLDIYVLEPEKTYRLPFDPNRFDYYLEGGREVWGQGIDHYAGFLSYFPFDGGPWRECVSYLGASYYRAIGSQHVYGSSVRGLAVDIAAPNGEVFPRFTNFWIRKPEMGDKTLQAWALLDSPPVAGAYQFLITPGSNTTVEVKAEIFARTNCGKVALAPITSMFWHRPGVGENTKDFRPRVHDSEGLLVHQKDGGWLWRPVDNPKGHRTTSFADTAVTGYGMIQRHRNEADYGDKEALYHKRPSVWITPLSGFDKGSLELYEIHAEHEGVDNLGAYWVLGAMSPGDRHTASWLMDFRDADPPEHKDGKVVDFRVTVDPKDPKSRGISVTFQGGFLETHPEAELLRQAKQIVTVNGTSTNAWLEQTAPGVYTLTATVNPAATASRENPFTVSASLHGAAGAKTETWQWREHEN